MTEEKDKKPEKSQPIMEHITELRKMLTYSVIVLFLAAILCFSLFKDQVMFLFQMPVDRLGITLNYMGVSEAFTTQVKISFLAGAILAMPIILVFLWKFISPALFPNEKKAIMKVIPISILLFVGGVLFAYLIVLNFALEFLLITMSGGLTPVLSFSQYVKFMYGFLLPFGFAFELPLLVYFLTKMGITDTPMLKRIRKYVFFIIVVISAVITPPDVLSQIMLAIPLYGLYEISIIIAGRVEKSKAAKAN